jgi:hypothetical protein
MSRRRVRSFREKQADKLAKERQQQKKQLTAAEKLAQERRQAESFLRDYQHRGYRQAALGSEGARPNNMAPSKYMTNNAGPTVSDVNIIYQGIDSIWLNITGSVKEDVLECLQMAKEDAQEAEGDWALSPLPPFLGVSTLMYASGIKGYDYLCRSDDVEVDLRRPSKSPRPSVVVRVSAQALARMGDGGKAATLLAAEWLRSIFEDDSYVVTVKKVHIATDWQGYIPQLADLESVVKRAGDDPELDDEMLDADTMLPFGHLRAHRSRGRVLTGIAAGVSTNIRLNCYDKLRQSTLKKLDWVQELWASSPRYNARLSTWRNEFQYGREFLHKRGIETIADLFANLGALWGYGMGWYSFRIPSLTDSNRSRWAVAGFWQSLSTWGGFEVAPLAKVSVVRPKFRAMCAGAVGYITSLMALAEVDSPYDALGWAFETVESNKGRDRIDRVIAEKRQRYSGFTMGAV